MAISGVFYDTLDTVSFNKGIASLNSIYLTDFLLAFEVPSVWALNRVFKVVVGWGVLFRNDGVQRGQQLFCERVHPLEL